MTAPQLSDFPLFEGIRKKDLQVLLPCLNAGITLLRAGDSLRWDPDRIGMITEGCLGRKDADTGQTMGPGAILRAESAVELTALTDTAILRMDRDMVYGPCWFSCSFHHRIADNLNRS